MAKPSVKRAATEQTPIEKPVVETTEQVVEKLPDTPIGDDTPAVSSEQVQQLLETQTEASDVKGPEITPEQVQEALESTSLIYKLVIGDMNTYITNMAPNVAQSESTGNSNQVLLFRNFQRLFRLEDGEFLSCIQEVLDLFANRNNAALQDDMPFRFVQNLNLNKEQRQLFTRLIQLFQTASNVELRGAVAARTNLAEISRLMGDDRAAQRLEAFFNK